MISIVIPAYNEEKVIGDMLSRLRKGLSLPHEIVVSDDKSSDRTVEIARGLADKVLIFEKKHATIAANRNAGAKAASGELLAFMDADCSVEDPNAFFAKALERFSADPGLLGLTGIIRVTPETETFGDRVVYLFFNAVRRFKNNVSKVGEASGEFQMVRKSAFEKIGGYREDLVTREDSDLFWRLSRIGRTYCDADLVVYQTGRRSRSEGWLKLVAIWTVNSFWVMLFNRSFSKDWKPIR